MYIVSGNAFTHLIDCKYSVNISFICTGKSEIHGTRFIATPAFMWSGAEPAASPGVTILSPTNLYAMAGEPRLYGLSQRHHCN